MIVFVCKHHDGFCLWPARYTPHSVRQVPGVTERATKFAKWPRPAKSHGVKLAVYLSPADIYQLRTNPKNPTGYYGNGSKQRAFRHSHRSCELHKQPREWPRADRWIHKFHLRCG